MSFADGLKCLRYQEIREMINHHILKYIEFLLLTVLLEIWEPFKKPIKCGLSKKNIFIEIKNLRKIALRDFGYFSCVFI